MSDINLLVFLVAKKNDINRRRRRFYHIMASARKWDTTQSKLVTIDSSEYKRGLAGYNRGKLEMKSMTPVIRKLRKELNARLIWGGSGNVCYILMGDLSIDCDDMPKYIDKLKADHAVNNILLGDVCT